MKQNIDDLGVCGIIVDDWSIEKSFKPKTITTDYESWTTYISRRPVPANTPITDTYYWKPLTRLQTQLAFDYKKFKEDVESRLTSMDIEIQSFLQSVAGGTAVIDKFGDNDLVAVNQKTTTDAINKLWQKIEDITGEVLQGFNMTITPGYYIGETGADVHITANTVEANGIFEHIAFYGNNVLIVEADNVDSFEYDFHIDETTIIKCVAKIMGIEYRKEKAITHYNSFWLGCGTSYTDIMDVEHVIPITNGMRGSYDVHASDNDRIILVVGESLDEGFIRADMNGIEIPMTVSTVTVDEKNYKVFVSEDVFNEGVYNIDING